MKFNWKYILLFPVFLILLILPFVLTSCDDPATFFQKYGSGQNNNNSGSSDSGDSGDDSGSSSGPIIPSSPY